MVFEISKYQYSEKIWVFISTVIFEAVIVSSSLIRYSEHKAHPDFNPVNPFTFPWALPFLMLASIGLMSLVAVFLQERADISMRFISIVSALASGILGVLMVFNSPQLPNLLGITLLASYMATIWALIKGENRR